jgi:phage gpG-like protein
VGTNVRYAAIHEFGFRGSVSVRGHARKGRSGSIEVGAYSRQVNLPARSFLRSSLDEMAVTIRSELRASALRGLK